MVEHIKFDCGCTFPVVAKGNKYDGFKVDLENIPFDCARTWNLYGEGKTKISFQTESQLGKQWCKRLKPTSIEELADIISIIRPVTLKSFDEAGENMTTKFWKRKMGMVECTQPIKALEGILAPTQQIIVYQEQIIEISSTIAGFNLQEADNLRKSFSKKDAKLLSSIKTSFIEGCAKVGAVNEEEAGQIWELIWKSNRYLFNKSHAVAYAVRSYKTMYVKAHSPVDALTAWFCFSGDKQDTMTEVKELVSEARQYNINVLPPSLEKLNRDWTTDKEKIYCGLMNVKGLADKQITKLEQALAPYQSAILTWYQFLTQISDGITSTVVENLINIGALPFDESRLYMLFQYRNGWSTLTDKEKRWIRESRHTNLVAAIQDLHDTPKAATKNRLPKLSDIIKILKTPPVSLKDTVQYIRGKEIELLGTNITRNIHYNTNYQSSHDIRAFLKERPKTAYIQCSISRINEHKTKKGNSAGMTMAFLTVEDDSGEMDAVCFADAYEEFGDMLYPSNDVLMQVALGRDKDSAIINQVWQV